MIFERKKYLEELVGARINLIKKLFFLTSSLFQNMFVSA